MQGIQDKNCQFTKAGYVTEGWRNTRFPSSCCMREARVVPMERPR